METIKQALHGFTVGKPTAFRNLGFYPVQGGVANPLNFLALDEALERGVIRIAESGGGMVPEIVVTNDADIPVLLLDGEELVGCKQNRIINLSILVPPLTTLNIPVSCVEQGRWSWDSTQFSSPGRAMYASMRARKAADVSASMSQGRTYFSCQDSIWSDIDRKAARLSARSPTRAMSAMYEQRQGEIDAYCRGLTPPAEATGVIFVVNGRIRGVELFDSPGAWNRYSEKIVRSYALDAVDEADSAATAATALPPLDEAVRWMGAVADAPSEEFGAIGAGVDVRFVGGGVLGGALFAHEGNLVHLCAFGEGAASARSDRFGGDRPAVPRRSRISRRGPRGG